MTPTKNQQVYRSIIRRLGSFAARRLHRLCPTCRRFMTYCAERHLCTARGYDMCVRALCIRCGFEGSVAESDTQVERGLRGAMRRGWVKEAGNKDGEQCYRITRAGSRQVEDMLARASGRGRR